MNQWLKYQGAQHAQDSGTGGLEQVASWCREISVASSRNNRTLGDWPVKIFARVSGIGV